MRECVYCLALSNVFLNRHVCVGVQLVVTVPIACVVFSQSETIAEAKLKAQSTKRRR